MKHLMRGVLVVAAIAIVPASLAGAAGNSDLKLKPSAFSCPPGPGYDGAPGAGNGQNAQAQWTNKKAESGKFSVLLQKSAATNFCAGAAALVDGVEGELVSSLGSIGFSVNGPCGGGSPRFNLLYDNDGDGIYDGYAFYGCGNHISGSSGGWTQMDANPTVPDAFGGQPMGPNATVVQLYVLVDETGTYYIDNVQVGARTVGEPNGS